MIATGSRRREAERLEERTAADVEPSAVGVDVDGTVASGVDGVVSETGPSAGVVEPGTEPAEGEIAAAGEADGVKAAGPGAGTGALVAALHWMGTLACLQALGREIAEVRLTGIRKGTPPVTIWQRQSEPLVIRDLNELQQSVVGEPVPLVR